MYILEILSNLATPAPDQNKMEMSEFAAVNSKLSGDQSQLGLPEDVHDLVKHTAGFYYLKGFTDSTLNYNTPDQYEDGVKSGIIVGLVAGICFTAVVLATLILVGIAIWL